MLDGVPVDQCFDLEMEHKEFIGAKILELCLLEILKFRYMQTDPNWANFLYNPNKKQVKIMTFHLFLRRFFKFYTTKFVQFTTPPFEAIHELTVFLT